MTALIGWLYRSALKRGARGDHWAWYLVALGALILRRDRDRRSASLISVPIKPGDRIEVSMRQLDAADKT